jgi:hypothetical protein
VIYIVRGSFSVLSLCLAGGFVWVLRYCLRRGYFGGENVRIGVINKQNSPGFYKFYVIFFLALIIFFLSVPVFLFFALGS